MNQLEAARAHQRDFLQQLKAKTSPYIIQIGGIDVEVHPGVFPPTTDTYLLTEHIRVKPGDEILELTTGSGAISIIAGLQGARGLAGDLNEEAIQCANANFKRYGVDFRAVHSDLFQSIPRGSYDWIFANGPYTEGVVQDPLELAFYGARDFLTRLFSEAGRYLKPQGRIMITFAEWGEVDFFEDTARINRFSLEVLGKKVSDNQRVYRLYQASKYKG